MSRIADELRASDIPITDVSAGSTPTAFHAAAVAGVTEIRPGTYVSMTARTRTRCVPA